MSWTRLDDSWTDLPELEDQPYDTRWHYLAMVQFCSRTKKYDGVLRMADARRASDVHEPDRCIQELVAVGLVEEISTGMFKLLRIDDHIPPPSVRENAERTKERMQAMRQRKSLHAVGNHSECLPGNGTTAGKCQHAPVTESVTRNEPSNKSNPVPVTEIVTRNLRTGQDRTGQASFNSSNNQKEANNGGWVAPPVDPKLATPKGWKAGQSFTPPPSEESVPEPEQAVSEAERIAREAAEAVRWGTGSGAENEREPWN